MKYLICSIIKNEHRYLAEWIEHHLSLGFTDIYLFEDFGSKNHSEITDKYPQVHLNTCDNYFTIKRDYDLGWARQIRLYQKFLNEHHIDGWCAFIDIDEYIFLNDGYTLDLLTQEYSNETGIALFWKLFNANNRIYRVDKVVESYTQSCNLVAQDIGWGFKSFVNLLNAKEFKDQHLIKGLVDTNRNYIAHRYSLPSVYDKIQLNHYFTKSYEDWCDRFFRGDLAPNHRKWEAFFEQNPTMKNIAHYKHELNRKKYKDFKSEDLISVVMCTYNRAKFLDNVISNILNQTYTNLEFVIVDDGSTDNSKEILEKWKEKDSRVRVIYSKHDFCNSRNISFKEAKGKYIACIDSDDECSLDRLEKQYKYLQEHPDVDVLGTKTTGFDKEIAKLETHEEIISNWTPHKNELVVFGTIMLKKSILDNFTHDYFFRVFEFGGEDTIFKLCLLNYGARFANLQEYLYHYNTGQQSMTHSSNYKGTAFNEFMNPCKTLEEALNKLNSLSEDYLNKVIPKVIHYCWFGKTELPDLLKKCIASWSKVMPDYKILRWDESNFDINVCPYVRDAYQDGNYSFVSDYARNWIIYNYGGIYLDTDVELVKDLTPLVEKGSYFGFDKNDDTLSNLHINEGIGFACEKGNFILKELMSIYESETYKMKKDVFNTPSVVLKLTNLLQRNGFKIDNSLQTKYGITLYPTDYFCPIGFELTEVNTTENTYSIHWYTANWGKYKNTLVYERI